MAMRIVEAYQLLGLKEESTFEEAKRSYRSLMRQFHPDSAGNRKVSDKVAHQQAQRLNEAYRLVKNALQSGGVIKTFEKGTYRSWKDIDPGIPVNPMAYWERSIFLQDEILGMEHFVDTGLVGRYYWDPEVETFELLLRSVNMAVSEMVDELELDDESMFKLRSALLHLLLQEFIDPVSLMDEYVPIRKEGGEYLIHCGLRTDRRTVKAETAFEVRGEGSRLFAVENEEIAGQVTFVENALYYIVTPLVLQGAATAEVLMTETAGRVKKGILHVKLTGKKYNDRSVRINDEIRKRIERAGEDHL